jgi:Ca-activated chloride channel family protein
MSDDEFDRLAGLLSDTPPPDAAVRARHLALAQESFARRQGSGPALRRSSGRPRPGRRARGVFVTRPFPRSGALLAGTALVACAIIFVSPAGRQVWQRYGAAPPPPPLARGDAPAAPAQGGEALPAPRRNATLAATTSGSPPPAPLAAAPDAPTAAPAPVAEPAPVAAPAPAEMAAATPDAARAPAAAPASAEMAAAAPDAARARVAAPAALAPAAEARVAAPDSEAFANAPENPVHVTAADPVSTFSIDVDTAAWSVLRQSLSAGRLPPPDAVRIEEMINYFPYDYPAPGAGEAFRADVSVFPTPWNRDTLLARIGIQGEKPATAERPPLNLVFLVDTSGSMQDAAKLPLLVASLKLMLPELRPDDEVAIVTYAGSAGVALPPTRAGERDTIAAALDALEAEGSTNGEGGLSAAYALARGMRGGGEVARVVLATDGDFNVGLSETEDLAAYIARQRESGVDLSVLGFGRGNLDDATMQALAQNGNGQAAYIDTLSEARKVLVDQLVGTLFTIARDVKIQLEWNPATVAAWRLIGYETRALARTDFANDRVDAGELGAGAQVTALYELTPVGSRLAEPLRYGGADAAGTAPPRTDELGFLRLRWKAPGSAASRLAETPIAVGTGEADADARFAAAIAAMGQLLRRSPHGGDWSWAEAIALAEGARGADPFGYRAEAVRLMRLAEGLSR